MFKRIMAILTGMILVFCSFITVSAENTGKIIYQNDFSSNVLSEDFQIKQGTAELVTEKGNQYLQFTKAEGENGNVRALFGPQSKNYDIDFNVRITLVENEMYSYGDLCFRSPCIPTDPYITYRLQFTTWQIALINADIFADNGNTLLPISSESTFGQVPGLWYNMRVCTRDNMITVFINGEQALQVMDDMYNIEGGFAFFARGMNFDVDNIVITEYQGNNLPIPQPNEVPLWKGTADDLEEEEVMDTGLEAFVIGGGEKDVGASAVDPNKLTINSYIAIGLITALVLMAVSTLTVTLLLLKEKKKNKGDINHEENS